MISSLLVANRGEIAVRVIRACRALGIRAIAVYSDADARALHVHEADAAYHIGPAPASESYLSQSAILRAARESGAQAIHPGYGFLAENADFAQACIDAGLVWVGPPPAAMRALGDKVRAKALAERAGVPLLPGYHGENQAPDVLADRAGEAGYPLMIKASAGGGGRGMRVVEQPGAFREQLEAAQREAQASFGDSRVLLERYVRRPRHVEVQVLGDLHGSLVHLGERECSIQRRHQKLIEESPSPAVTPELRWQMGEAALRLARAAGYANAGTVEFILDEDGAFFFLEVNTRLQVEHPVTEAVTGLDLVQLQIRLADGERLTFAQEDVRFEGHAVECRLIAEDPLQAFLPSTGTVEELATYDAVRIDSGVAEGSVVSPYYDSLLAKLIAHGPDRDAALDLLVAALRETEIEGVRTNLDLLLAVVQHPAFRAGDLSTRFLEEHRILDALQDPPPEIAAAAAVAQQVTQSPTEPTDPWRGPIPWRIGGVDQPSRWRVGGHTLEAFVTRGMVPGTFVVRVGDRAIQARSIRDARGGARLVELGAETAEVLLGGSRRSVRWQGQTHRVRPARVPQATDSVPGGRGDTATGTLAAPMPGRIVKVAVAEGQRVHANQPLVVLEAMKMEHVVEAPHPGAVTAVRVKVGDQVTTGAILVELAGDD